MQPDQPIEPVTSAIDAGNWEVARALLARLSHVGSPSPTASELDALRHQIESALVRETDWAASAVRWKATLAEYPDEPELWPFAARCFIQVAELEDADRVLGKLCERYSDDFENWMYYAMNAEHQHRWSAAVERWDRVIALRPDDPGIKTLRGDAIWNAEMQAADEAFAIEA